MNWFRRLYNEILEYRKESLYSEMLVPWIEIAQREVSKLASFKSLSEHDLKDVTFRDMLCDLYALGRVNDLLLTSFQQGEAKVAVLASNEYESFFTQIGFEVVLTNRFAPFHHEIVKVHQADDADTPIQLRGHLWPELMFGKMLFSRAGVEVVGGRDHIIQDVAEQSTLYFSYLRKNRKTMDLSIGWGHNSQWGTDFRRDYVVGNTWVYNADGKDNLVSDEYEETEGLEKTERIELCRNRCFISTTHAHDDLWPYYDRFEEDAYA